MLPVFGVGSLRSLYLLQGIDASSGLILFLMTLHTLQKAAGLTAKASTAARHANGNSSSRRLYIGGLADGSNASAARRAAGEALAIAALRIPGELKHGRGTPPLTVMLLTGAAVGYPTHPDRGLPSAFEAPFQWQSPQRRQVAYIISAGSRQNPAPACNCACRRR